MDPIVVAVVGSGDDATSEALLRSAHEIGGTLAGAGAVLVCGGLAGVMAAAARGAREGGGTTIGILPGSDRRAANPYIDIAIPTGLGEARNTLVVRAADAVIAVGGQYGTLSEIAFALKIGVPVIGLGTWELHRAGAIDPGITVVTTAGDAAALALRAAGDA